MSSNYTLNTVYTTQQLQDVVDFYSGVDEFVFDVESLSGTSDPEHRGDPRRNRVVWIALAHEGRVDVIPMQHPHGDYLRTEYPLLASGKAREAKGLALRPQDYSKDEKKAVRVFGPPPSQLNAAEVFEALRPILMSDKKIKAGHNVGFDLQSVAKYYGGTIPPLPYFCTMIAGFILDSRDGHYLGLDDCLKREFGHIMVKGVGKDISKHDFHTVEQYAAEDAYWTWMLMKHYQKRLVDEMSDRVMRLDMDTLEGTLQMEMVGSPIDQGALQRLKDRLEEEIEDAKAEVFAAAGKAFAINSNPVKQQLLFAPKSEGGRGLKGKILTPKGKQKRREGQQLTISDYAVSAEALELFAGMDPLADALLKYADLNKLMSTYVIPYMGGDVERTTAGKTKTVKRESLMNKGRIHTQFVFTGAESGRFSSRNPNLQNVPNPRTPNGKAIRDLFVAPPGCRLVVADYAQIEPRVMASFSEDPILMAAFLNDEDVYTAMASPLGFNRSVGKVLFLAAAYGIGPDKIAADLGLKLQESKDLLENFETQFSSVYRYKREVIKAAKSRRPVPYVKTLVGRRRYLPDLRLPDTRGNYGFISRAERQAFNCVDLETEALTRRGWLRGDDILLSDELLTKNADTGVLEWQPVKEVRVFENVDTELISIESKSFSALTTPNHRWLVTNKATGKPECRTTDRLSLYGDHRIHRTGEYVGVSPVLKDHYVELAGWFLTDGSIIKANNGVYLCQSSTANPDKVARIIRSLDALGVKYTARTARSGIVYFTFHDSFADALRAHFPDRVLTPEFLGLLTKEQAMLLVEVMMLGDGHTSPTTGGRQFTCRGETQKDMFQWLCTLAGIATTAAWRDMSAYVPQSSKMANVPKMTGVWAVSLLSRDKVQVHRHQVEKIQAVGTTVWCPVVANTYFVARRKDKVYVTGNTVIQGSAADIIKVAMVRAHRLIPDKASLILTVHDELVTVTPEDLADETAAAIREAMEGIHVLKVPLISEIKVVDRWGDGK